ncbi:MULTISPECIES: UPF0104 family protein [Aerosakkonema]|uniref:UPF0104 family protein n=1 Tax=Aerosakkonema TaxID=1246629 RepID=UPI0035BB253B
MKQIQSRLLPYLRWAIVGGTLFFLAKALKDNAASVAAIRIGSAGWAILAIATGVTLLAHIWSGWVWSWILRELHQPIGGIWSVRVYLKTNIAKYLPGNVWHYYGRIKASCDVGICSSAATLSVLLEPLLMAAAALLIALLSTLLVETDLPNVYRWLEFLGLAIVSIAIHPKFLNPLIQLATQMKAKAKGFATVDVGALQMKRYPLLPLLGEMGFLSLRGLGFLCTWLALKPVPSSQVFLLLGAFCVAWLLGLVVPGAPGGVGVFETSAIALLDDSFSPGLILSVVALYRLVSILAEAIGAGLIWLDSRLIANG